MQSYLLTAAIITTLAGVAIPSVFAQQGSDVSKSPEPTQSAEPTKDALAEIGQFEDEDSDLELTKVDQCPKDPYDNCTLVLTIKRSGKYKLCHCSGADGADEQQTNVKLLSSAVIARLGANSCDYIKIDGRRKKVCTRD